MTFFVLLANCGLSGYCALTTGVNAAGYNPTLLELALDPPTTLKNMEEREKKEVSDSTLLVRKTNKDALVLYLCWAFCPTALQGLRLVDLCRSARVSI